MQNIRGSEPPENQGAQFVSEHFELNIYQIALIYILLESLGT